MPSSVTLARDHEGHTRTVAVSLIQEDRPDTQPTIMVVVVDDQDEEMAAVDLTVAHAARLAEMLAAAIAAGL